MNVLDIAFLSVFDVFRTNCLSDALLLLTERLLVHVILLADVSISLRSHGLAGDGLMECQFRYLVQMLSRILTGATDS